MIWAVLLFPLSCILLVAALAHFGALAWFGARPLLTAGIGMAVGMAFRRFGLPGADPEGLAEAARLGLAVLVFLTIQQCRPSRLARLSPAAARLGLLGAPLLILASGAAVFAILPGLGLWSALLVGSLVPLGLGAVEEARALTAPIPDDTKRALRLEAAYALLIALPIGLLVAAAGVPPEPGDTFVDNTLFEAFAGAAVGGAIGLLGGRFLPIRDAAIPAAPLVVLVVAYLGTRAVGYDALLGAVAAGLLYAEEAPLLGPVRSRLYSAGVRWCAPPAFFALGAALGPVLFQSDPLIWLAALVPPLVLRPVVRSAVLGGTSLPVADKGFLSWFGGAPAAAAALFTVSLLGSASSAAQEGVVAVATVLVLASLAVTRLTSTALIRRLVHASARARKRRYGTA
ncbi:hypothetical protein [Parvularcula dongshanensis]|uniref:NhaP-type Na+/H+ or K+/H+ antiporter n=1 Tax=Parvularcula dongshanensis TaxID=1173995 RepID=A0A840I0N1_9PROT|nr:hypothetical protein [Parvularcula dongshanensis]MBB4657762.1 NhaP-type Na+/H+ or K+/H+ antiporter [Parvularcula dongshanensis]